MNAQDLLKQLQGGASTLTPSEKPKATTPTGVKFSGLKDLLEEVKKNPFGSTLETGLYEGTIVNCELTESKKGLSMLKFTLAFEKFKGLPKKGQAFKYSMLASENPESKAPLITVRQIVNMLSILGAEIEEGQEDAIFESLGQIFKDKKVSFECDDNGFVNIKTFEGKKV